MSQQPDLISNAQGHVESLVKDLTGEDDFLPFMLVNGIVNDEPGHIYVGLDMPGLDGRDDIADVMMALVAMYRATEVAFASCSWILTGLSPQEREEWGNRSFADHPARKEMVFLLYLGEGGAHNQFFTAMVTRADNKVSLSEWADATHNAQTQGRFAEAIRAGLHLAKDMPPEMTDYMTRAMAEGQEQQAVLAPMIQAFRRVRSGQITEEERKDAEAMAEQLRRRENDPPA